MFPFSWPSLVQHESALPNMANIMQTKSPVSHLPTFNKMKRKRHDSGSTSPQLGAPPLKRTAETMSQVQISPSDPRQTGLPPQLVDLNKVEIPSQAAGAQPTIMNALDTPSNERSQNQSGNENKIESGNHIDRDVGVQHSSTTRTHAIREAIEAQFGLEILLKHRELRLIDQEFAKCQAGLEQLRRCHVIPFPAISSDPGAMLAVSDGQGATYGNRAPHAPPWGVTDGPYSRHYQRWLIPDFAFDDTFSESIHPSTTGGKTSSERATRGSKHEVGTAATLSRSQRGSQNPRLKALPHGYPEPKEEKGPMIVKRGSDGKMVKLVCLDCRRSNFNSAQGFINHCRIAHSRQFASHDAAIEASGEEIDVNAEGGMGERGIASQATASSALVHPLIRSAAQLARVPPTEPSISPLTKRKRSQPSSSVDEQPYRNTITANRMSTPRQQKFGSVADPTPFTPSPQTPHLSALFAKLGRGGDLNEMVNQAKASPEVDLSLSSDDEDEDVMEVAAGTTNAPQSRSTRGVLRESHLPPRQANSSASLHQTPIDHSFPNSSHKPAYLSNVNINQVYPSPYYSDDTHDDQSSVLHNVGTPFNLSPNTIESHPAPSLVSDDGDYENTHSDSESPSSAEVDDEDHYVHAEVMDHDDLDLGEGSSAAHHIGLGEKPHAPAVRRRSSAMRSPMALHNGETQQRRVSFANPTRRPRRDSKVASEK